MTSRSPITFSAASRRWVAVTVIVATVLVWFWVSLFADLATETAMPPGVAALVALVGSTMVAGVAIWRFRRMGRVLPPLAARDLARVWARWSLGAAVALAGLAVFVAVEDVSAVAPPGDRSQRCVIGSQSIGVPPSTVEMPVFGPCPTPTARPPGAERQRADFAWLVSPILAVSTLALGGVGATELVRQRRADRA